MEPAGKLTVIGVLVVVLILLMIGVHKENSEYNFVYPTSDYDLEERKPELSTPMYYLVVGSFVDVENANNFGQSVESSNHDLYILPKTDGYIRVGIFTSPHKDAVEEFQKMSRKEFPKSWITYQ